MSIRTPWDADARYHRNGMPSNMAAILRDQYRRRFSALKAGAQRHD